MANVNRIALCRHCKQELTFPLPDRCPVCSNKIIKSESSYFDSPAYLSCQLEDHLHDLGLHKSTAGQAEHIKAQKVFQELVKWSRECPAEDKVSALSDAKMIVSEILHADVSGEVLSTIIKAGKAIGEISIKIDEYIKAGGSRMALPTVQSLERNEEEFLKIDKLDVE